MDNSDGLGQWTDIIKHMPKSPRSPEPPREPFRVTATDVRDVETGRREYRLHLPAGVTKWDLQSGEYRRLYRGVYVHRDTLVTERTKVRGALLLSTGPAAASHHSAARIWGGIVPDDGLVHISTLGNRPQVVGIRAHRGTIGGQRCRQVRGMTVTTPVQTFVDLGTELGLVDLVVLGDSLVKAQLVTPKELVDGAKAFRGGGRRLLRRAASLVRSGVDSPMESKVRMLMILGGLPEPTVNFKVTWPNGATRFRFDLSYPDFHVVIEYDGRQHAESDQQWDSDIDRREWMDAEHWRIVVIRSKDIYNTPGLTLQRIISAMRDKGMAVPRLSGEWRLHFPGRPGDLVHPA